MVGAKSKMAVKPQIFTVNFPSTFTISPGGHQVFPITFDEAWAGRPDFGKPGRTAVKLKAVYGIVADDDSKEQGVWAGRVESEVMEVEVNHW